MLTTTIHLGRRRWSIFLRLLLRLFLLCLMLLLLMMMMMMMGGGPTTVSSMMIVVGTLQGNEIFLCMGPDLCARP
jgi:hypothetical protein